MKKIVLSAALIAASFTSFAQVGIGTTTPEGVLDVVSTNSALILPRVANTAAVAAPVNGMLVYDLSSNCFKGYQNGGWSDCGFAPSAAALAAASDAVLTQIGNEADSPDTVNSVVTAAQLSTILPAITGVEAANQTAYQDYIDANPGSFSSPATQAEVQAMVDAINNMGKDTTTAVVDVVSTTGQIWMDRNLGATQVATISTDAAAYGDLYQWGRAADGHQLRTSATTSSQSATSVPAHGDFITHSDWLQTRNDTLWQAGNNDPCPSGYRIPTETELNNERSAFGSNNAAGAYDSVLKLPVAGLRLIDNGTLSNVGSYGNYWSSTNKSTVGASLLSFNSSIGKIENYYRRSANSVRCIKE